MKNGKTTDVVNVELLIKFLCKTQTGVDVEKLFAITKANEHLAKLGLTWDQFLKDRITVIGDPFANIIDPRTRREAPLSQPHVPNRPTPTPAYQPTPRAAPKPPPAAPKPNQYPGLCRHCSRMLQPGDGLLGPKSLTTNKWTVECRPGECQTAKQTKNQRASVSDLASLVKGAKAQP